MPLKAVYNYSDRGEFSNNGFINQLTLLGHKLDLMLFWDFGAPNHNKDLCDAEGHVMKTGMDNGTDAKVLRYGSSEEYCITAANYCREHLSTPRNPNHTREFIVHTEEIQHMRCDQVYLYSLIFLSLNKHTLKILHRP